jgi:DNA-binding NarL/FixJ family response regulator
VNLRILIVDDNGMVRAALREFMRMCDGWIVCGEAADGMEAVEKAAALEPDIILMDVTMPKLNGLEATRIIRKKVSQSEVVILSQNPSDVFEQVAINAGARAYVEKSEIATALLPAIEAASRHERFPASANQ